MGFLEKLGFVTKCESCDETQHLMRCPYCSHTVCDNCLAVLVSRKSWPEWFVGRKVSKKSDFDKTVREYASKVKEKGASIHLCNEYLDKRWANVQTYMRQVEERFGKKETVYDFRTK